MKNSLLIIPILLLVACQTAQQPTALPGTATNPPIPALEQFPIVTNSHPKIVLAAPPLPPGAEKVRKSVAEPRIRALAVPEPAPASIVGLATISKLAGGGYQVEFRNWSGPYWISSSDDGMASWHKLGQGDAGTNGLTVIRVVDKENVSMRFYRLHF